MYDSPVFLVRWQANGGARVSELAELDCAPQIHHDRLLDVPNTSQNVSLYFGIASTNQERTQRAFEAVAAQHPVLAPSVGQWWTTDHVHIVAESSPHLPLRSRRFADGAVAVLGMPGHDCPDVAGQMNDAQTASDLAAKLFGADGRHLVIHTNGDGEVCVGVDMLGFTPLYVWQDHELLAFASSPGLLLDSGLVRPQLDLHGLACALMLGHMALSRTIWQGICRPNVGRAVSWSVQRGAREYDVRVVLPSDRDFGRPYQSLFDEFVERLDAVVLPPAAAENDQISLSLSGGIDSRILIGTLRGKTPAPLECLVYGLPHEDEVRCAGIVARAMKSPLTLVPPRENDHPALFKKISRRETLTSSLWNLSFVASMEAFEPKPTWFLSGTFGDHLPGGCAPGDGYDEVTGRYSAKKHLSTTMRWGVPSAEIGPLFSSALLDRVVAETLDALRAEWNGYPGEEFQRAWLWTTRHRMRFHLAPNAWRQSGICRSYQPFTARSMVEFCAGLPLFALQDRRLETDLLRKRLPMLASLPLDRNSGTLTPLAPSISYRVSRGLLATAQSLVPRRLVPQHDRRTYHRTYDFDGPGWMPVREALEPIRARTSKCFNQQQLVDLLPPPTVRRKLPDSIVDGGKSKVLLALLYLAEEYALDLSSGALGRGY